jgi:hypothetical protein
MAKCIRRKLIYNPYKNEMQPRSCKRVAVIGDFCKTCFRYLQWKRQEGYCSACTEYINDPVIDSYLIHDKWILCRLCWADYRRYRRGSLRRGYNARFEFRIQTMPPPQLTFEIADRVQRGQRRSTARKHVLKHFLDPPPEEPVLKCYGCGCLYGKWVWFDETGEDEKTYNFCYRCWRGMTGPRRRMKKSKRGPLQQIKRALSRMHIYREWSYPITFADESKLLDAQGILSSSIQTDRSEYAMDLKRRYRRLVVEWHYQNRCPICKEVTDQWSVSWEQDHAECLQCFYEKQRMPFKRKLLPLGLAEEIE